MLFEITHRTRYHYSCPVFLEPMTVRLRPRSDAAQTVRSYSVKCTPGSGGISHCIGLDGNNVDTIWFSGLHEDLLIEVCSVVETHCDNPFNFLVTDPVALSLPVKYEPHLAFVLAHYLTNDSDDPLLEEFAAEVMQAAKHETIPFLTLLSDRIHHRFEYMLREHGDPWTAEETIKQGRGSCRDFAVLFIDICRRAGIAARFVSGYCIGDEAADSYMHAWVETYLPGAGWRGFDPSLGLSISNDYIAVAAGQRPQDAAPTNGSFRGSAVATMKTEISICLLEKESGAV